MADVFVSYSRRDKARVAPLVEAIEGRGWSVWWDREIAPGQEFDRRIDAELKAAGAVLVIWTPESVESRWVRGEAREAADRGVLVPVRFDGATLPLDARVFHTIDLDDASLHADAAPVRDVLDALDAQIGARRDAPAPRAAPAPAPKPEHMDLCVLPFASLGGDAAQQAFCDGLTEDLTTELSRWRFLSVRSRSDSYRYAGMAADVRRVGRELGVRFVVEGSVRRVGDRLRITAQVIDVESGSHVWGEKYDCDADARAGAQDEVVRTIVATLVGRVQSRDTERTRWAPPSSLAAYQCVLKGNALPWADPEGRAEATRLFEQAIALDPGYGLPYGLLAAMRADAWLDDPGDSPALLDEAYALARRGVELDPNESTCYSMLAQACLRRRQWDLALQYMRRATELNPNNQWNIADMGFVLGYLGEPAQALAWMQRAREVDPFFDPPWYYRMTGLILLNLHRYEEALAILEQAPGPQYRNSVFAAACLARLGRLDEARAAAAKVLELKPDYTIGRQIAKEPLRNPEDAAHLAESLRMAGLPE